MQKDPNASASALAKSFRNFLHLLRQGKFATIFQILQYDVLNHVIRPVLICGIRIRSRMFPTPADRLCRCPSCGQTFPQFYPAMVGDHIAFHVQCPYCKSYERHRAQFLYYQRNTDLLEAKRLLCVLHCAPEELFYKILSQHANVDYYTMDKWEGYTVCGQRMRDYADLTGLPYEDGKFDYILCNHVLEHIPDEQKALGELYRVLKNDGTAFLNVPLDPDLAVTLEDPAYNTDALRLKYYGQRDHVRKYGRDYQKRLERAGFVVTCVTVGEYFSKKERDVYGLLDFERIYVCQK